MPVDIEDKDSLLAYLRAHGRIDPLESPYVKTLTGGVSSKAVYLRRRSGDEWVLKQALPKLRVAVDWPSNPDRTHNEARGIGVLARLLEPGRIPPLVFEDREHHLLAMEAVPQPFQNWKDMLLTGRLHFSHVDDSARLLARIHRLSARNASDLASRFSDRRAFEELRVNPFYAFTAAQHDTTRPFISDLIVDMREHRVSLVHGDFSPKNILIRPSGCVLIDHEVVHWGDPAFDLGFFITHLLSKANHLYDRRDSYLRAAQVFWTVYRLETNDTPELARIEDRAIRHTAACLLARVDGKSPLEYLDEPKRERQRLAAIRIIRSPPKKFEQFLVEFKEGIADA